MRPSISWTGYKEEREELGVTSIDVAISLERRGRLGLQVKGNELIKVTVQGEGDRICDTAQSSNGQMRRYLDSKRGLSLPSSKGTKMEVPSLKNSIMGGRQQYDGCKDSLTFIRVAANRKLQEKL